MQLYISRTCRNDGWVWDSWVYSITCTLGMDGDEYAICSSHGLLEMWVWHSEALVDHYDNAYEGFDTAANTPLFPQNGMLEWYGQILHSFGALGSGLYEWAAAKLSLKITIGDLVESKYIEADTADELRMIEAFVKEGCELLAIRLGTVLTYIEDTEEVEDYGV